MVDDSCITRENQCKLQFTNSMKHSETYFGRLFFAAGFQYKNIDEEQRKA